VGGLVDASLDRVLGFELSNLGTDKAEDGDGVLRQVAQRGEVTGARGVVLEQIACTAGSHMTGIGTSSICT
jgi:hypothetical protein